MRTQDTCLDRPPLLCPEPFPWPLMGEFDDVMAMEPSDHWDLPVDDGSGHARTLPEVVAVLRLPGAFVELRGEVPDALVDRLEPLRDERLHLSRRTIRSDSNGSDHAILPPWRSPWKTP